MKLFLKKIFNTSCIIKIRNLIGFRTIKFKIPRTEKSISISDSFIWRTDNNFQTILRFTDILKKFYEKSQLTETEIIFYSKDNIKLKSILIDNNEINNELIIDKNFLNNTEDYGLFYIYHSYKNNLSPKKITLSNRCYVGYSKNGSNPSFVHGNYLARFRIFGEEKEYSNLVQKTFLHKKTYKIQKNFKDYDKTELCFANPTNSLVKFKINGDKHSIGAGELNIINVQTDEIISISSKLLFFRPIIFNYKRNFIDIFHS